jgi:hypothetical protein
MVERKPKTKPKRKAGLTQKQRFIEAARYAEVDETGKTFERHVKVIVPSRLPAKK